MSGQAFFWSADENFLMLKPLPEEVKVQVYLNFGSAVDWFVRIARIDPKSLPDKMIDLKSDKVYERVKFSDIGFAPATRLTAEVLGVWGPFIYNVVALDIYSTVGSGLEFGASQVVTETSKLSLEKGEKDAVYTVTNFHPTWSPDGTRIAFVSNRSGSLDLFLMNADGSNPINVSNSPAADDQPAWSPDGQDLAFVSDRDGNPKICLMKPDDSDVRRLTNGGGVDVNPAWTARGEVMFSSNREDEFELFAMNRDGSFARRLTLSLGINVQPNAGRQ